MQNIELVNNIFDFSKELCGRLGIDIKIDKKQLVEYIKENDLKDYIDIIDTILNIDILKIDFDKDTIYINIINALGTGQDHRYNRIIEVDRYGHIEKVYNGLYEELKSLDLCDVVTFWALEQYLDDEVLRDMIDKKVNEFFE